MILAGVPKQLIAGDTWRWTKAFADYPAPTWTVTYYFENASKQFSAAASADGTSQAVSIAATDTSGYPPGRYRWYARAVSGAIKETIDGETGEVEVQPDPAAEGTRDTRTWARRALDAIEAAIEGKASSAQKSFTIGSRSVESYEVKDLLDLRTKLKAEVQNETNTSSGGRGRQIKVRMSRT